MRAWEYLLMLYLFELNNLLTFKYRSVASLHWVQKNYFTRKNDLNIKFQKLWYIKIMRQLIILRHSMHLYLWGFKILSLLLKRLNSNHNIIIYYIPIFTITFYVCKNGNYLPNNCIALLMFSINHVFVYPKIITIIFHI